MYWWRLKDYIRAKLKLYKPQTIEEARHATKLIEQNKKINKLSYTNSQKSSNYSKGKSRIPWTCLTSIYHLNCKKNAANIQALNGKWMANVGSVGTNFHQNTNATHKNSKIVKQNKKRTPRVLTQTKILMRKMKLQTQPKEEAIARICLAEITRITQP